MPKSVFTGRIASGRRALKKQFAGNRKDSATTQTTAGEDTGSHYPGGCGNLWGTQNGRKKRKRWGLAFSGVEGLSRVRAPADRFSATDPVFASGRAVHSVRHEELLGRSGQAGPNAEHSRPRLPLVRLSPATFDGCARLFPLFFKVAFLKQDPDDLATGKLVVTGDNVNGCLDVHEHIAHARPFLSFSVELGEVASHDISLPGRSQL